MAAASDYTEANIINAMLRGVAYPLPTKTYISLHTADPGESAGGNEVSTTVWPSYVRREAEQGGTIGSGWTAPVDGMAKNVNQITYPSNNGTVSVTVTHWALWDAPTGGNMLVHEALFTPRTLMPSDVFVFDQNVLMVQAS